MSHSSSVPWSPPSGGEPVLLPAGRWWDAVRVPAGLGPAVLAALGERTGAVMEDATHRVWTWLVEPGAATAWPHLEGVYVFTSGLSIPVPPAGVTTGPLRWLVLPATTALTEPEPLLRALTAAWDADAHCRTGRGGEPVSGLRCDGCGTGEAVTVSFIESPSGPGWRRQMCPVCLAVENLPPVCCTTCGTPSDDLHLRSARLASAAPVTSVWECPPCWYGTGAA
ncbi:hypothetical protein V1J52_16720 [Streptomyces sp. TRM 70351]|uniref:hypothetical protein n=1 Tax=Streptomyces sp. TRM 70351 TaxID=3116552 RepID=UPI002E7B2C68|nr:hypothetical protein [Streptomyces sp. TRM 70351]MEE1929810.1 hypothetical protein [Streptomyces sp. TRM 70351]